ncbi:MAG: NTP transferase domain-containing protein [Candidatus Eisenbacteria bacterium]|nr:NTP transferase domain-containing protein [Candidatus Eisenbacteria bacterium]
MRETVVMLLAGGGGTRLNILAKLRAKPAVPFGGMYRIIDFTLSNVMNSGIGSVAVLTQYKPISLMNHLGVGEAWDMTGRTRGVKILPPRTGERDSDWYRGTADAIRQNIEYIHRSDPKNVLILSGDHIYGMDYRPMLRFHRDRRADLTIAMMEVRPEETRHFGIARTGEKGRVIEWQEKPVTTDSRLASMGIYVFDAAYMLRALRSIGGSDFGNHVIPTAVGEDRVYAYPFRGYWKDVGTLQAFWEANRDLLDPDSGIDLESWRVRTNPEEIGRLGDRPPAMIAPGASVSESLISPGCEIRGEVVRSILSPGVIVAKGARVEDSVIMNDTRIDRGARVSHVISDKQVWIGEGVEIGTWGAGTPNQEFPEHLSTGLTVIGKQATVPAGCRVGQNTILYPSLRKDRFPLHEVPPGSTLRNEEDR